MSVDQLFGKYRRLKKDLSAAYSQPQWNAALVDRLVDEISQVEKELALHAPNGLRGPAAERGRPGAPRGLGLSAALAALAPRSLIVAAPEIRRCTCGVPQ